MPRDLEPIREWLERAAHDMRAAEVVTPAMPEAPEIAVFHHQQAAEKYLKAYLTLVEQSFQKTHNLELLVDLCVKHDPRFEEIRSIAAPLSRYAVHFRYPTPHRLTPRDLDEAAAAARVVRDFVLERIHAMP